MTWRWLSERLLRAVHLEQLAEHGGSAGIVDEGLLSAALARPRHLASYGEPPPDVAQLAAAYAFGLVKDHPFTDGNKRVGFVAAATFITLNGWELGLDERDVVEQTLALAAGTAGQDAHADWLRSGLIDRR